MVKIPGDCVKVGAICLGLGMLSWKFAWLCHEAPDGGSGGPSMPEFWYFLASVVCAVAVAVTIAVFVMEMDDS